MIGREGRLDERMSAPGANGRWAAKVDCFNTLLDDLARPIMEISRTIGAAVKGDLRQSMELDVNGRLLKGEFLRSAKLVNAMIDRLAVFAAAVEIGACGVAEAAIFPIVAADQLEDGKSAKLTGGGTRPGRKNSRTVRKQQAMIDHRGGDSLASGKTTSERRGFRREHRQTTELDATKLQNTMLALRVALQYSPRVRALRPIYSSG